MNVNFNGKGFEKHIAAAVKDALKDTTMAAPTNAANRNALAQAIGTHVGKAIKDSIAAAISAQRASSGLDISYLRELILGEYDRNNFSERKC